MGYTAHELAKLSGVSVRTLHYYEEQGLLRPQRRPNGYRDYGPDDVRRLQQVLLYRRASMPLAAIRSVLDQPAAVQADALREQLDHLREQQRQLGDLIVSVERLIDETRADLDSSKPATPASQRSGAERNTAMDTSPSTDAARFEALKQQAIKENEAAYGAEARKRYGDTAVDTANRQVAAMTQDQWGTAQQQSERIGELIAAVAAAPDPAQAVRSELGRELCETHRAWLLNYWSAAMYSPEAHRGLAQGYVDDPRFTAYYEAYAPGGAAILRDAVDAWVDEL